MPTAEPVPKIDNRYERRRLRQQDRDQQSSLENRDIYKGLPNRRVPNIANVKRRREASKSCKLFFKTYNPSAFYLDWSKSQLIELDRMEEVVRYGSMSAIADPRADGKTTRCRMLVLYAIANALRRYVFLIGANKDKADDSLSSISKMIRFLPEFVADFPEISFAVNKLRGIAQNAGGQVANGQPTLIEWAKDKLVMPTLRPPKNWPKDWELRIDGMVPTSGAIISASGLTGDGIRGSLLTLNTGEFVRPDFVVLDDPQTPESARSPSQNVNRYQLITADVLGMCGPDKTLAAIMPCTVIERGDMVDLILDRKKNPLWRGLRTKLLITMPTNMDAWQDYFEVYTKCQQAEPPNMAEANEYYIAKRAVLDEGAEASWPERKEPGEVSAIQRAMHLYFRDPRAFFSEYQNDPLPPDAGNADELTPAQILCKLNNMKRGEVPRECTRLTAFIDVGKQILIYGVAGFDERFGGAAIEYGAFPVQSRVGYFDTVDPRPSLADTFPGLTETALVYQGLAHLVPLLISKEWKQDQTGSPLKIGRLLIDTGWQAETIFKYIRESGLSALVNGSKGHAIKARHKPMHEWPVKEGTRPLFNGRLYPPERGKGRWVLFDANAWKSFFADRLRVPKGTHGSFNIFGTELEAKAGLHQSLIEHLTSERRTTLTDETSGRSKDEWEHKPSRPNHLLDCFAGCCVAAAVDGLIWTPNTVATPRREKKKMDFEEMARRAAEQPLL